MSHKVNVPDIIWTWAQRKSGNINPASWLRDNCLYAAMISDIGETSHIDTRNETTATTTESQWEEINMGLNPLDPEFAAARAAFAEQAGGDQKAIKFMKDGLAHGILDTRAWLMSWWNKQKPQAI